MNISTSLICVGLLCLTAAASAGQAEDVTKAVQTLKKCKIWNLTGGFVYGPSEELLATRKIAQSKDAEKHLVDILTTGSDVGRLFGALGLRFIESKKLLDPSVTAGIKGNEVQALHGCIMGREKDTDILLQITSGKLDKLETKPEVVASANAAVV